MTINDDAIDRLVEDLHADLDLEPGALDRIRPSLLASAAVPHHGEVEPQRAMTATVWEPDQRPHTTMVVLAAAVVTMFVVLVTATVRPGGVVSPAAAAVADDPGYQMAVEAYPQLWPEGWLNAGDQQRSELADGELTQSEYEAGFNRYRDCLNSHGYDFGFVRLQGPLMTYGIPSPGAVEAGVDQPCYDREWFLSDLLWQDLHPEAAENNLMLIACLEQAGLPVGGSADETAEQFERSGLFHSDCVVDWLASGRSWAEYPQ